MIDGRPVNAAAPGAVRVAAALFLALAAPATAARELVVNAAPCARQIEVRAAGVPLDEVLRAVTAALGVRLEAKASLPEPIQFKAVDTPERVLLRLMNGRNLVLDSGPLAKCGGREVLTTVWVLPAGEAAELRTQTPGVFQATIQEPGEVEFRALRPPRPRGIRKRLGEEEWQRIKKEWEQGKVQADPETGLPVPVEPQSPPSE